MERSLKLHRHTGGEHIEDELRYYRPEGFTVPHTLAGLSLVLSRDNPHCDRYYDALGEDGPLLKRASCSLRMREKPKSSERLVTFKRKISDEDGRAKRAESECAIECPVCQNDKTDCDICRSDDLSLLIGHTDLEPLQKAQEIIGNVPLRRLFSIANERVDHHFKDEDTHVVLSEDHLVFPDGSSECRVEIEFVEGDASHLEEIDVELRKLYPQLKACKRGKLSEGRRRMRSLLG